MQWRTALRPGWHGRRRLRARIPQLRRRQEPVLLEHRPQANGTSRTITLPEGKTLQVTIPEGAEDRQMLRLKEQGMPGFGGGSAGDAYVELHVEPNPLFRRKDDNIHVEVPVTLKEAVLGAGIEVPTIGGPVTVM